MNLSLALEVINPAETDAVLSKQIADIAQQCPRLRILTIHLLIAGFFLAGSATGSLLQQLLSRLDSLSIVAISSGPHDVVLRLRLSIADDKCWSNVCISHRLDGTRESRWPSLTIPSLIQDHVHQSCSGSQSSNFCYPPTKDNKIFKWTCQNKVNKDVPLDSFPVAKWVLELEKQHSMKNRQGED